MQNSERWIVGSLLTLALLTFFFPLAALQLPILGSQEVSGYDLISKAAEINQTLDTIESKELGKSNSIPSQLAPADSNNPEPHSPMPLSVQALPAIPIEIVLSFVCALIAFSLCFSQLSSTFAKVFAATGSLAAVVAILHLTVANSDLHSWFIAQMNADSLAQADNPFAGLAQQFSNLAANSIQLKPGSGLYVLAASLSVTTIILLSKVLSVSPLTEAAIEPSLDQDDGSTSRLIFGVLFVFVVVAAILVLNHKSPSPPVKGSFDGEFSSGRALTALFGNYDPSHKTSSVVVKDEDGSNSNGKSTLLLDRPFSLGSESKHLLVTSTAVSGEDCHACDAEIGAYVYVQKEGGWTPEIADTKVGRSGAWGLAGKASAAKFAPEVYGFSVTLDDGGQGEENTSEVLVAPVNGHFSPVLSLVLEADNEGNCGQTDSDDALYSSAPCYRNVSTVHFLNSVHHGYFDIEVDESGTENTDQGVAPVNGKNIYRFSGEKYIE